MDVIEMDAASRTGVDDVRELIDGVRYRPVAARFKVYIVDEVHMLSKNAFNALLKTLEEPPEHVKFIFATTEIGKVPITVLSRCQRFDLRRIDQDKLAQHLSSIAAKEGRALDAGAAALLARAADGSARDGLSLLDRALAHVEGNVSEQEVRDLLGLADRGRIFDLFEVVMKGDTAGALKAVDALYRDGADPGTVIADLLDLVHWLTRLKAVPALADDATVPEAERGRGRALASSLSVPVLTRAWQMLLKGLGEAQAAPNPVAALEMLAIRLAHAAELPTPGEIIASLGSTPGGGGAPVRGPSLPPTAPAGPPGRGGAQALRAEPAAHAEAVPVVAAPARPDLAQPGPQSFSDVVALCAAQREAMLAAHLRENVRLVRFEIGQIELNPADAAPRDLANRLGELLTKWTGRRWIVSLVREGGEATLEQQEAAHRKQRSDAAAAHPLVRAVLDAFPGATIEAVRGAIEPPASEEAVPEDPVGLPESEGDGEA
jgi:DNA polymerase-3 subunit gamma/tau